MNWADWMAVIVLSYSVLTIYFEWRRGNGN
jgi:hypothetical protein